MKPKVNYTGTFIVQVNETKNQHTFDYDKYNSLEFAVKELGKDRILGMINQVLRLEARTIAYENAISSRVK